MERRKNLEYAGKVTEWEYITEMDLLEYCLSLSRFTDAAAYPALALLPAPHVYLLLVASHNTTLV